MKKLSIYAISFLALFFIATSCEREFDDIYDNLNSDKNTEGCIFGNDSLHCPNHQCDSLCLGGHEHGGNGGVCDSTGCGGHSGNGGGCDTTGCGGHGGHGGNGGNGGVCDSTGNGGHGGHHIGG